MARFTNTNVFITGQKLVTTSGTPVQLNSNVVPPGSEVVVKAMSSNTGTITVGNSSANALNSGSTHFKLAQNQSLTIQVNNTGLIWIDATVSGEGVEFIVEGIETI